MPYVLEPISNEGTARIKASISGGGGATLIKPNSYEAAILTGLSCKNSIEALPCAKSLYDMGAANVLLSLGADGFYYYGENFHAHFAPKDTDIINKTAIDDTLFAAAFMSILHKHPPLKTAVIARHAAAMTCNVHTSVRTTLSPAIFNMEIKL